MKRKAGGLVMEVNSTVYLKEDFYSHCNRHKLYGKANEKLKVTAVFYNVLIVESSKGEKFAVHKDKVKTSLFGT